MNSDDFQKWMVTFTSLYAKRIMESQYTRLMETKAGQRLRALSLPSKLAIEGAMYAITAYLSTKERLLGGAPIKAFLWEVAKDAPSELAKRMLNGDGDDPVHSPVGGQGDVIDVQVLDADKQTVLEGLLQMKPEDLETFLTWLEKAPPSERRLMAEAMSSLPEEEQRKLVGLSPERARVLFESARPAEPSPESRGAIQTLADKLRTFNEKLEEQRRKSKRR